MSQEEIISGIIGRLNEVVEDSGLTITEFAKSINTDRGQFGKVLSGNMGITLKQIIDITSRYGVRAGWLLEGEGDKKSGPLEVPDSLLTQIENYAQNILLSLKEVRKEPQPAFQPGTDVAPLPSQTVNLRGKKKTSKKQEGI